MHSVNIFLAHNFGTQFPRVIILPKLVNKGKLCIESHALLIFDIRIIKVSVFQEKGSSTGVRYDKK